jgi:hypothetical protein
MVQMLDAAGVASVSLKYSRLNDEEQVSRGRDLIDGHHGLFRTRRRRPARAHVGAGGGSPPPARCGRIARPWHERLARRDLGAILLIKRGTIGGVGCVAFGSQL